eukprot:scaffold264482_cov33-Tisochrysis_lutea.AAC.5
MDSPLLLLGGKPPFRSPQGTIVKAIQIHRVMERAPLPSSPAVPHAALDRPKPTCGNVHVTRVVCCLKLVRARAERLIFRPTEAHAGAGVPVHGLVARVGRPAVGGSGARSITLSGLTIR